MDQLVSSARYQCGHTGAAVGGSGLCPPCQVRTDEDYATLWLSENRDMAEDLLDFYTGTLWSAAVEASVERAAPIVEEDAEPPFFGGRP